VAQQHATGGCTKKKKEKGSTEGNNEKADETKISNGEQIKYKHGLESGRGRGREKKRINSPPKKLRGLGIGQPKEKAAGGGGGVTKKRNWLSREKHGGGPSEVGEK